MRYLITVSCLLLAAMTGCGTVYGTGKAIEALGQGVGQDMQKSADFVQRKINNKVDPDPTGTEQTVTSRAQWEVDQLLKRAQQQKQLKDSAK